jgi:hypothetical protein
MGASRGHSNPNSSLAGCSSARFGNDNRDRLADMANGMAGQRTTAFHATEARRLALVNGRSGGMRNSPCH